MSVGKTPSGASGGNNGLNGASRDASAGGPIPLFKRKGSVFSQRPEESDEQIDALADLFLGEVESRPRDGSRPVFNELPPSRTPPPPPTSTPPTEPNAMSSARPMLRLRREDDEWGEVGAGTNDGVVESRPVLRHAEPKPPRPAPAEQIVEWLVLGNLPVLASAWASQYVREVSAAAKRPVALVRLQSGFATLEIVGGAESSREGHAASLEDAVRSAALTTDRWVVRCDGDAGGEAMRSGVVRVVTVLTGTDEAARSAAAQVVGGLKIAAGEAGPAVRVAVMGRVEGQVQSAGEDIGAEAERVLGRPVQRVVMSGQIRAGRPARLVFSGATSHTAQSLLNLLAETAGLATAKSAPSATWNRDEAVADAAWVKSVLETIETEDHGRGERAAPMVTESVEVVLPLAEEIAREHAAPAPSAGGVEPQARHVERETVAEPAKADSVTARPEEPAEVGEIGAAAIAGEAPVLSSLLSELRPIALECPYAKGVELAMDGAGGMHLLARSESGRDDDAVARLMTASAWAEAHARLLSAGVPGLSALGRPKLHLFTDAPKRSRGLVDTAMKLHLLARVHVGGQSAWYCTELN